MSAILKPQGERTYTTKDLEALPDDVRAELIDGVIYDMGTPTPQHQRILMNLATDIKNDIRKKGSPCEVYPAPFAVFLNKNDKTNVQPDISVICDASKIDGKGCNGAPDWIIEIVSSSSYERDYGSKLGKYMTAGVQEYWIVDPKNERVMVYRSESPKMIYYFTFSDTVPSNIFEGFSIDFSKLDI